MSTGRGVRPGAGQVGDRFPRATARTRRFTLGEPRSFTVLPDGSAVLFLRSADGTDPVNSLWALDLDGAPTERLIADPQALLADPGDLPEAEAKRRERAREVASGIVSYSLDRAGRRACFSLGGRLFVTDVSTPAPTEWASGGGVFDPRLSPDGERVAYVAGATLRVTDGARDTVVCEDVDPEVAWGAAEFVAAEEMGRTRGFWWSPRSTAIAVARVDNGPVQRWYVADGAEPGAAPAELRYPAAGTANADVSLWVVDLDGGRHEVVWDRRTFPYLANVEWPSDGPLTLTVQSRDQRTLVVLCADETTGVTEQRWRQDDERWVELTPGVPRWHDGALVALVDRDGARRLVVDGEPVTPVGLQVRAVLGTLDSDLVISATEDPTELHLYRITSEGPQRLSEGAGVHGGTAAGDTLVLTAASMSWFGNRATVQRGALEVDVASRASRPPVAPRGRFFQVGSRQLRAVVLEPRKAAKVPDGPLPVLLDPYGGPHALRVVRSRNAHLSSQWFADQGFAVVVIDGRGTPGRGPAWEREVWGDFAGPVLDDQVSALMALAARDERLDLTRVGIKGWSFGGYLAALAVLRRPDVFHAAVAGAPVTDWRLYDTHYTERYLGHPDEHPEHYERTALAADAANLRRPLLMIHGLADDNVVAAHTFRFSAELLAAGSPHQVLPLSGVTHMTPQEVVAENLLLFQLDFLRTHLQGTEPPPPLDRD